MRLALGPRWPALMRDYGMDPRHVGDYTYAEIVGVLKHQNDHWQAIAEANRAQKRR